MVRAAKKLTMETTSNSLQRVEEASGGACLARINALEAGDPNAASWPRRRAGHQPQHWRSRCCPGRCALLAPPEPFEIKPAKPTIKGDQPSPAVVDENDTSAKTASGDVIRREVTVFWNVKHGPGNVTIGWNYKNGSGGVPVGQYCYYALLNGDR